MRLSRVQLKAMPYRILAHDRSEEAARDALEIEAIAVASRARHRIAALGVAAALVGVVVLAFLPMAAREPPPVPRCHNVSLRYVDAPQIPPREWTACTAVPERAR
jgi:hypothetical protein